VITRIILALSGKILQGLFGLRPADSRIVVQYVESLIFRSTVLMGLKMAFTAPLPACCWSKEVDGGWVANIG
jgi:hypothetical protein